MPLAQSDRRFSVVTLARWSSVPMSDRPSVTADTSTDGKVFQRVPNTRGEPDLLTGPYYNCFSCHVKKAFETEQTTEVTGFRAGDRNLHWLYVSNKEKGRTCRACHELHGGDLPKQIAATVPFGDWQLPTRWQQQPTGGTCAPGCHRPFTYSRGPAAEPSKPAAPEQPPKK
jgi:hypothetical protein